MKKSFSPLFFYGFDSERCTLKTASNIDCGSTFRFPILDFQVPLNKLFPVALKLFYSLFFLQPVSSVSAKLMDSTFRRGFTIIVLKIHYRGGKKVTIHQFQIHLNSFAFNFLSFPWLCVSISSWHSASKHISIKLVFFFSPSHSRGSFSWSMEWKLWWRISLCSILNLIWAQGEMNLRKEGNWLWKIFSLRVGPHQVQIL